MSFLAPVYLLTLLFAIPIVLLWFLKQRREPLEVPTSFLWRRALAEERVSPLLRSLTTSLLLLLQIIALVLLAFAAASAVLDIRLTGSDRTIVVLLDRSGSMATQEPDGATRLDLAKRRVETLLETLRTGDRIMLVAFDRRARILAGFTADTATIRRRLNGIRPHEAATDPAEALRVAAAATATIDEGRAEIFFVSDGAFPPVEELPPELKGARFVFVGVGAPHPNAGIVSLGLDDAPDTGARLFVGMGNPGGTELTRTISLCRDGKILDARDATLPARGRAGAVFDLTDWGPGPFELALEPHDAYPLDDVARVVLREEPVRRLLLVTAGSPTLERLKDFRPRLEVYTVSPADATADVGADVGSFDLTIFDGEQPEALRPGTGNLGPSAVWIACTPRGGAVSLAPSVENPDIVDWDRGDALNRNVDWSDVLVARGSRVLAPAGATSLLETTGGTLIAALPGAGERIVIGFRLEDSNFPLRLAFPIFFANLLDRAFHPGGSAEAGYLPAGRPLVRRLPPGVSSATVEDPSGGTATLEAMPDRTVSYTDTDRSGFYRLTVGPRTERIAVSFLSASETDIAPRDALDLGGQTVPSTPRAVRVNYPLRISLLLAVLAILLLEWTLWLRGAGRRRRR